MKVLGIVGSPRKDGNCDVLVKEFLDAVGPEFSFISVGENSYGHPHNTILSAFERIILSLSALRNNND